ncbi:MAG: ATP-binding protein, partial [bacterium]|nr:ATP-binding protein [bacterium]
MAESQVQKRFNKSLFARGDTIVVAVSGGADSMVLLELVAALSGERELTVHAAHVNYGLRGEDSFKDEQLVR